MNEIKDIKIRAWIDPNGIVRSINSRQNITAQELGLLILEIERSLNQFKTEYFSKVISQRRELK